MSDQQKKIKKRRGNIKKRRKRGKKTEVSFLALVFQIRRFSKSSKRSLPSSYNEETFFLKKKATGRLFFIL